MSPCKCWCKSVGWGFSPTRWNITPLWPLWLSCPFYLDHAHSSTARPHGSSALAELLLTLYSSNDVFPFKRCLFGGGRYVTLFRGNMSRGPLKVGVNRHFQAKTRKSKKSHYLRNYKIDQAKIWGHSSNHRLHFVGGLPHSKSNMVYSRHL